MSKQQEIIATLGVKPEINPAEEVAERVAFLQEYLGQTGLNGFVLGISGGQDSLLAGILAQRAVEARRAEGHEAAFHAMLLPHGEQADRADAELAIDVIKPDYVHDWNIQPATREIATEFACSEGRKLAELHKGNVKARMRMIAQYAIAGEYNLLVVGTDHASEAVMGFYTKYGDGGADILPLAGLTKTQGSELLHYLGAPALFSLKDPTADLRDDKPGQPDEVELGVTYTTMIDPYLIGQKVPAEAVEIIEDAFDKTEHKRQMPVAFTDVRK